LKRIRRLDARAATGKALRWIQPDQIEVGILTAQELRHALRFGGRIIPPLDQRPTKENPPPRRRSIITAGLHQLGERPAAIARNERGTLFVARGMQAHGQIVRLAFIGETADARDDADGADGDSARAEIHAARVGQSPQRLHRRLVVVQRLAHPHEHEIPQSVALLRAQPALGDQHLRHDFPGPQMPHKAHLARGAKDATHGAAGLGAQAGGVAPGIAHDHRLNLLAVVEAKEELLGEAIAARDLLDHGGRVEREIGPDVGGQPATDRRKEILARQQIVFQVPIQSFPEGARVDWPQPVRDQPRPELVEAEVVQRGWLDGSERHEAGLEGSIVASSRPLR